MNKNRNFVLCLCVIFLLLSLFSVLFRLFRFSLSSSSPFPSVPISILPPFTFYPRLLQFFIFILFRKGCQQRIDGSSHKIYQKEKESTSHKPVNRRHVGDNFIGSLLFISPLLPTFKKKHARGISEIESIEIELIF